MRSQRKSRRLRKSARPEKGFTLLEMILASAILLVGIASVVQLVPASLKSDLYNRMDTMATTIAQHELDQMVSQLQPCPPQVFAQLVTQNANACKGLATVQFTDKDGNTIRLGGTTAGLHGSALVMYGASAAIDFSAAPVTGYNLQNYRDPNDPTGATFELRWAVLTTVDNGALLAKRIVIGCRHTNTAQPMLPINLDTSVQK